MSERQDDIDAKPVRAVVTPREAAFLVLRGLVDAGYVAYFAGGCVRDHLMGQEPEDYDIATSARPAQVLQVFPRAQAVGESFGVMLVRSRGYTIEVATFRTDGVYSDGRHPDQVSFSDAEHDARRRDFTINGLFEDPIGGRIIDFVDGRRDLEAKTIRAIGDPYARLREDRLRMLRAVRFAARFGFAIEAETAEAIRSGVEHLQGVSRERIGQELRRMLTDPNRAVAAWELQYLGLDAVVLGEGQQTVAPTRLGRLPDRIGYSAALAAWLLDRHSEAHQADWSRIAERWRQSLVLSNAEHQSLERCLAAYRTLVSEWDRLGVAGQKRLAASLGFQDGLMLIQTEDRQRFIDIRRRVQELEATELAPTPLIDGEDLIAAGLTPGPQFQRLLDAVYDGQLEGLIQEKAAALKLALEIARNYPAQ
ncbi:MAG TPA: CCA tRNA nucleotidyltransferase [Phycisphaerales bacterium]|nr:CCA tRNA nucleotidyltransferase [Phycisphaerales bacterium]